MQEAVLAVAFKSIIVIFNACHSGAWQLSGSIALTSPIHHMDLHNTTIVASTKTAVLSWNAITLAPMHAYLSEEKMTTPACCYIDHDIVAYAAQTGATSHVLDVREYSSSAVKCTLSLGERQLKCITRDVWNPHTIVTASLLGIEFWDLRTAHVAADIKPT